MRALLLILALSAPLVHATTIDTCVHQEKEMRALKLCVEAERNRAANHLREANQLTLTAVNQKTKTDGRKTTLREFRSSQARHVRTRAAQCRQPIDVNRIGCEADADFGQIERLKQLAN